MRLSTRLFVVVGSLLLVVCALIFLIPLLVIHREAKEVKTSYLSIVREQEVAKHANLLKWLQSEIGSLEGALKAHLNLLADIHPFTHPLQKAEKKEEEKSGWLIGSHLLRTVDTADFFQVTDSSQKAMTIFMANVPLYSARRLPLADGVSSVFVQRGKWMAEQYIGIQVPWVKIRQEEQLLEGGDTLLLFRTEDFSKDDFWSSIKTEEINLKDFPGITVIVKELVARLEKAKDLIQQEKGGGSSLPSLHLVNKGQSGQEEKESESAYEISYQEILNGVRMGSLATALSLLPLLPETPSPLAPGMPFGAAHFAVDGKEGEMIFTKTLFSEERVFDAALFYKEHPPQPSSPKVASDFAPIDRRKVRAETIASVLSLGGGRFLTLGNSMDALVRRLSAVTHDSTLLLVHDQVIERFVPKGELHLSQKDVQELRTKFPEMNDPIGFVTLGGADLFYGRYRPVKEWNLELVTLQPAKNVLAPVQLFEERSTKMVRGLSLWIFGASLLVFVIALAALEFISRRFTRPIRRLATATQEIEAAGHYTDSIEKLDLPQGSPKAKNEALLLAYHFEKMVKGLAEREKIRGVLDKVVSKEVANEILQGKVELGGEGREVTVLFADIRDFTHLTEHIPPERVIEFLNAFMTKMTAAIEHYRGVIDKYVGDEVMALFGAPVANPSSALQGLLAAVKMMEELRTWNQERQGAGLPLIQAGIGLATGHMVAGNMGAEDRLNYTVVGARVNLASRLCDMAQPMEILIPDEMYRLPLVESYFAVEPSGTSQVKGFEEPITLWKVLGFKEGVDREGLERKALSSS